MSACPLCGAVFRKVYLLPAHYFGPGQCATPIQMKAIGWDQEQKDGQLSWRNPRDRRANPDWAKRKEGLWFV